MKKVKLFGEEDNLVRLKNEDKINIDHLVGKIIDFVDIKTSRRFSNFIKGRNDPGFLSREGLSFFSNFSTNFEKIIEKQKLFKLFMDNEKLVTFLVTEPAPFFNKPNPNNEQISIDDLSKGTLNYVDYFEKFINLTKDTPLEFLGQNLYENMKEENIESLHKIVLKRNFFTINLDADIIFSLEDSGNIRFSSDGSALGEIIFGDRIDFLVGEVNGYINCKYLENNKLKVDYISMHDHLVSSKLWDDVMRSYAKHLNFSTDQKELKVNLNLTYQEKDGVFAVCFSDGENNFNLQISKSKYDYYSLNFVISKKLPTFFSLKKYSFDIPIIALSSGGLFASSRFLLDKRNAMSSVFSSLDELIFFAHVAYWYIQLPKSISVCYPIILPKEKKIMNIIKGINPILFDLNKVISNNFMFNIKNTGYVITGANAGGKTALANMVAYNQLFTQLGIPVFAKSAKISLVDNILLHYTESLDINSNQSRYSSELKRLKLEIIDKITPDSLVIFDEPFSGTSEISAKKQAIAVLRVMDKVGCRTVMTTHLHKLIPFVENLSNMENAHFELPQKKSSDFLMKKGGLAKSSGEILAIEHKVTYYQMMKVIQSRKL